ncbi:MAG: acyl-ACP--UDP-N-acetylglucosamine O-acyltransferase [candidate division Zixibacteria bacterium]|nr:acyl-ACP--UDP-N-acetylglucosamine O-acyltransferase [candidate division Zixibacteria bacterium]
MSDIHPTAIVSKKAELADDVVVGPYAIIEDKVVVGSGSQVASAALLASGTILGKGVRIHHGAVIGTQPQDLKFGGEITTAEIGDNTIVREYATVNRGTVYHNKTTIGRNCMLMAYSHVAHDCIIGDNVIIANSVNLAGHIDIGDYAIIGGVVPVHQFVRIGAHAMIGGGFRVQQDVCPYALVAGYPLRVIGINLTGLKRRGFSSKVLRTLESVYKILFFSKLNTSQALERIKTEVEIIPEVQLIIDFIETSTRGFIK